MQVVAIQLDSVWEDKPASHDRVRSVLAAANIQPHSLIVLPEMFDTGFSMNVQATAQDNDLESEEFLRGIAAEYNCAVLGGVVGPILNGQASNEAVAFSPDGRELARYRKNQPFTPAGEDTHYGAGHGHVQFEWNGVRVAPFICYDLRFPEVFRPAARDGAELLAGHHLWLSRPHQEGCNIL